MVGVIFFDAVVLLGILALALSQIDTARPFLTLFSSQLVEAKGLQLLLDNLTPTQREQYDAFGYFDVVGSKTGRRYRIHHGTSRNVIELERGGAGRCFMPKGELVAGDCMLAQKIALENCEEEVLHTALRF
jgi:hypothetical protein